MLHNKIIYVLIFGVVSSSLYAEEIIDNLYVGAAIGSLKLQDNLTKEYFKTNSITLQVGYKIKPYLSIEGRYSQDMGKVKYENGTTSSPDNNNYPTIFSSSSFFLKPNYSYKNITLYTLLGYGDVSLKDIKGASRTETGFQWGVGLAYNINKNIQIFSDYTTLYNSKGFDGRAIEANIDVNLVVVGMNYEF